MIFRDLDVLEEYRRQFHYQQIQEKRCSVDCSASICNSSEASKARMIVVVFLLEVLQVLVVLAVLAVLELVVLIVMGR